MRTVSSFLADSVRGESRGKLQRSVMHAQRKFPISASASAGSSSRSSSHAQPSKIPPSRARNLTKKERSKRANTSSTSSLARRRGRRKEEPCVSAPTHAPSSHTPKHGKPINPLPPPFGPELMAEGRERVTRPYRSAVRIGREVRGRSWFPSVTATATNSIMPSKRGWRQRDSSSQGYGRKRTSQRLWN